MPKKSIFYRYDVNHNKSVSNEHFEIPKSCQYMLLYDCEDSILLFLEELMNKFSQGGSLITDEQIGYANRIKELIKEFRENDGYRLTPYGVSSENSSDTKVREFWGEVGVLLQYLWI